MDYILNKYCPRIEFNSYEDFFVNFKINVPEDFNFGYDVVDEWARVEPEKHALMWCNDADEERLFEYHRRYLDVFTLAEGCERIDLASPGALSLREQRGDYHGCAGEAEQSVVLRPGSFLVLFPGDAHRPGMAAAQPEAVSRIVFKILL